MNRIPTYCKFLAIIFKRKGMIFNNDEKNYLCYAAVNFDHKYPDLS